MDDNKENSTKTPFMGRIKRQESIYDFNRPTSNQLVVPFTQTSLIGIEILRNPRLNKGLGFTWEERKQLNLHGLMPAVYRDITIQAKQVMHNIKRMNDRLDIYMYFMNILETNEKLFYFVLINNLVDLMPIVYTPTVGLACQKFGYIFTRPRGMYITIKDRHRVYQMLKNWPENDVRAICMTDGQRILGLGDLGAFGMGIPIGKLALYTGCAGIKPEQLLPVMIDVGCNNDDIRDLEFYIGIREKRITDSNRDEYDKLIKEFMDAACHRWGPTTLIQFEDFGNSNAFRLLKMHQNNYCTFNDDIQGTASVALAGLYSSLKVKGAIDKLSKHTILMYGAGSAGIGIANYIVKAMVEECNNGNKDDSKNEMTEEEARKNIWLVDSKGLIFKGRKSGNVDGIKKPFAHEWNGKEIKDLAEIIKQVKATCIIGVSGQGGAFTEDVCKAVYKNNKRPIIFPMSNPTDNSECSAKEAYESTENNCIFASGSPFDPVKISKHKEIVPAQGNNAYIFPGVALGIIASRSSRVPDEMFIVAAKRLSDLVTKEDIEQGSIYPPLGKIRQCSLEIACAVAQYAYDAGLATEIKPKDIKQMIQVQQFEHGIYMSYEDTSFDSLEDDFSGVTQ